jgi:phosphoserine phosphatase
MQHAACANKQRDATFQELPESLLQSISDVEKEIEHSRPAKKIAVFDLDNTLLVGDIGESVFAALKLRGYLPGVAWDKYRRILNSNKMEAYCRVVTAMSGLPERLVHRVTLDVLSRKDHYLELEKSFIPVPYAHPIMAQLVSYLRLIGYQVHVISASNEISARLAAWHFFEIPPFNVFGIRQRQQRGTLTDELIEPLSIGVGKVDVYRKYIGVVDPLIAGGDSPLDVPMLQLTDSRGLSLWVGEDSVGFEILRKKMGRNRRLHFLQRSKRSEFYEESTDD